MTAPKTWKAFIALLWFALPVIALRYWLAWDRLPARLATHFDLDGHANGWMSRQGSMILSVVLAILMLTTATVILARVRKPDAAAWALLAMFYVAIGTLVYAEELTLRVNLYGGEVHPLPLVIAGGVSALVVIVISLASKRGQPLPGGGVLAEEVHCSYLWGAVLALPAIGELVAITFIHNIGVQIAFGLTAIILFGAAALAWSGFRYIFTSAGLEITVFGYRLRSVALSQIREYRVGNWNVAKGYGIRGLGENRAYVWGNKGVKVQTSEGEVFLGHSRPEQLIQDFDRMMQFAH